MPEYKWKPIEDLHVNLHQLINENLRTLKQEWDELKEKISKEIESLVIERIKREWAIETGKIERIYSLSEGMTATLIQSGISPKYISASSTDIPTESVGAILLDQEAVIEGLFDFIKERRKITVSYIREIHQVFTRNQDYTVALTPDNRLVEIELIKGDWKKRSNNPKQPDQTMHEYCPPEHVASEMDRLLQMHESHNELGIDPIIEAAFLHHRFTQIHPFQDGNGRIARALASLVLMKAGYFPFVVRDEDRAGYIDSLEAADQGDLIPFINFMVEIQERVLYSSILTAKNSLITADLSFVKNKITNHFDKIKEYDLFYSNVNLKVLEWKKIAEENLIKYKDMLKEFDSLEFGINNGLIYVESNGEARTIINEKFNIEKKANNVKFSIRLPKPNSELYELSIGAYRTEKLPEYQIAYLSKFGGELVGEFIYSLADDEFVGNLSFRDWLIENINMILEKWIMSFD